MAWVTQTLSSSLGRKVIMSLTGLFLSSFLIVHMAGNLQLFKGDNGRAFNEYTYFMTHNPVIITVSYLLYTSILAHALMAWVLTRHNQSSRPVKYAYSRPEANSPWSSRNMGILGTVLLLFIIIHMRTFWYEMHFGSVPMAEYDGKQYKDLYAVVKEAFSQWWYVLLYVISMVAIGFHLAHGFQSGFQSLGIRHTKYTPMIEFVGRYFFALIIPAAFAAMPIYVFLQVHGII
ncbi:succinate dehydrogenase cytochrome b subunit [Spirosoma utsteinense]|uniref:Succinate dehydrogenase / fumarate reductase cytochrome b subunit n=1 Tax=Spirosoma utsteinense TaxID=2585773 RepID=A0ABR6W9E9_9BACT|nr:succinate dehydrogenase cytochrome b subunit [Spirosoma utsteinense]MBC3784899.1 succinate dehydrogenase / fumarate reductase cytochrome b subunit [Spirosoma utsteinense]MBC3792460.1 succinate dehydrogenase / fumarate reductase cytochrome b subunit [Spirosoma utsteinense]